MQVGPEVEERVFIGFWGTEVSVTEQELGGWPSCTSSRYPGHPSGESVVGHGGPRRYTDIPAPGKG